MADNYLERRFEDYLNAPLKKAKERRHPSPPPTTLLLNIEGAVGRAIVRAFRVAAHRVLLTALDTAFGAEVAQSNGATQLLNNPAEHLTEADNVILCAPGGEPDSLETANSIANFYAHSSNNNSATDKQDKGLLFVLLTDSPGEDNCAAWLRSLTVRESQKVVCGVLANHYPTNNEAAADLVANLLRHLTDTGKRPTKSFRLNFGPA